MWLGIDIGTGGTRALLVDGRGVVRASCTAPHEDMLMERPLWAEQRPENWWDACVEAIRGVLAQAGVQGRQVRGIGLSGQMHGLVMLDSAGRVVRPALIWCDQRSQAQVDAVNAKIGRGNVLKFTANPCSPASPCPSCCGSATTSREISSACARCSCPRTTCASS